MVKRMPTTHTRRKRRDHIAESDVAAAFVAESRRRLRREYLPKIRRATRSLRVADVWWRPNPASNSIGNLLLHLDGNVRQWVVHGIGGASDIRRRDAEFEAARGAGAAALVRRLATTLAAADAVLARLDSTALLRRRTIQGYRITTLQAVYHVVEHFAGHTGQILYIAKARLDRDLALYPHLSRHRRAPLRHGRSTGGGPTPRRRTRFLLPPAGDVAARVRRGYHAPTPDHSGATPVPRGGP